VALSQRGQPDMLVRAREQSRRRRRQGLGEEAARRAGPGGGVEWELAAKWTRLVQGAVCQ
jgi:hypothetical protein